MTTIGVLEVKSRTLLACGVVSTCLFFWAIAVGRASARVAASYFRECGAFRALRSVRRGNQTSARPDLDSCRSTSSRAIPRLSALWGWRQSFLRASQGCEDD